MKSSLRLVFGLWLYIWVASVGAQPAIAIIIDDVGYRFVQDRKVLALPGPLTYAIIPNTPGAQYARQQALKQGSEIMVHMPMESVGQHHHALGTLTQDMDWVTYVRTIQKNLAQLPEAVAVNNHEGSLLTANEEKMAWLMQELAFEKKMAFVDSRTTRKTVAQKIAEQFDLMTTRRDVFLDNQPEQIAAQFDSLIRKARKHGTALAIAHPRPDTVRFLEQHLPQLEAQGIQLVKLSRMMQLRQQRDNRRQAHGQSTSATGARL